MATVTIGGRELRVLERHEAGSFVVEDKVVKARAELVAAGEGELHEKLARLVFAYVEPSGITFDDLRALLPADISPVIRDCIVASGGKVKEKDAAQGEAARP